MRKIRLVRAVWSWTTIGSRSGFNSHKKRKIILSFKETEAVVYE